MPSVAKPSAPASALFPLGFWGVVFLLNVGPHWHRYSSAREVLDVAGIITGLQALVALVALKWLVPRWLDRGQPVRFGLLLLAVLLLAAEANILFSYGYLEPTYPQSYGQTYQALADLTLLERMGLSPMIIRYILLSKLPLFSFPAAVLVAVSYYRRQQLMAQLREKQRAAELGALKNQLNPHFIFNTLNNIYALAVKSSAQTPEAVAKLAGILDYVLYRCNGETVSLNDELAMIEDYIALERLRFGDRMTVSVASEIADGVSVAPLLLLTLIENAFKHGVSQELHRAEIDVSLKGDAHRVELEVRNSKPSARPAPDDRPAGIGLRNLRRQLDLLYPGAYRLDVRDEDRFYTARLELPGSGS